MKRALPGPSGGPSAMAPVPVTGAATLLRTSTSRRSVSLYVLRETFTRPVAVNA